MVHLLTSNPLQNRIGKMGKGKKKSKGQLVALGQNGPADLKSQSAVSDVSGEDSDAVLSSSTTKGSSEDLRRSLPSSTDLSLDGKLSSFGTKCYAPTDSGFYPAESPADDRLIHDLTLSLGLEAEISVTNGFVVKGLLQAFGATGDLILRDAFIINHEDSTHESPNRFEYMYLKKDDVVNTIIRDVPITCIPMDEVVAEEENEQGALPEKLMQTIPKIPSDSGKEVVSSTLLTPSPDKQAEPLKNRNHHPSSNTDFMQINKDSIHPCKKKLLFSVPNENPQQNAKETNAPSTFPSNRERFIQKDKQHDAQRFDNSDNTKAVRRNHLAGEETQPWKVSRKERRNPSDKKNSNKYQFTPRFKNEASTSRLPHPVDQNNRSKTIEIKENHGDDIVPQSKNLDSVIEVLEEKSSSKLPNFESEGGEKAESAEKNDSPRRLQAGENPWTSNVVWHRRMSSQDVSRKNSSDIHEMKKTGNQLNPNAKEFVPKFAEADDSNEEPAGEPNRAENEATGFDCLPNHRTPMNLPPLNMSFPGMMFPLPSTAIDGRCSPPFALGMPIGVPVPSYPLIPQSPSSPIVVQAFVPTGDGQGFYVPVTLPPLEDYYPMMMYGQFQQPQPHFVRPENVSVNEADLHENQTQFAEQRQTVFEESSSRTDRTESDEVLRFSETTSEPKSSLQSSENLFELPVVTENLQLMSNPFLVDNKLSIWTTTTTNSLDFSPSITTFTSSFLGDRTCTEIESKFSALTFQTEEPNDSPFGVPISFESSKSANREIKTNLEDENEIHEEK